MPIHILLYSFLFALLLSGCQKKKEHIFKVGISQLGDSDAWRKEMKKEIERELIFHPHLSIDYRQANYNSAVQIDQIRELLHRGIDLLIVSPNEAAAIFNISSPSTVHKLVLTL